MRIETIMVGQMGTNCYLAWDEESKRGFLVDPGEQADKIIRVCSRYEIKPEAILLTHGHFDHIMAAKKVKEYYQIPVYAGIHEEELLADKKELAEHNMLVDLGRNDLGKISKFGSVKVEKLHSIERYSHVMHIVSQVEGRKKGESHPLDLVASFLPAGTLSGAPKIRAMEIIDELESVRRGLYGGATGYIDFGGDMDFCITIRTMVKKGNEVYLQAGAGIVADSVPENEYYECCNKVMALAKTLVEEENL